MPKGVYYLFLVLGLALTVGCSATRDVKMQSYIKNEKRVDQEIEGALGNWANSPDAVNTATKETRKVFVLEITKDPKELDEGLFQREPYKPSSRVEEPPAPRQKVQQKPSRPKIEIPSLDEVYVDTPASQSSSKATIEYVVTKDDTLQKISKKFYNSFSKWPKIYEANKSVLKNPDVLVPGTKIQIPME